MSDWYEATEQKKAPFKILQIQDNNQTGQSQTAVFLLWCDKVLSLSGYLKFLTQLET